MSDDDIQKFKSVLSPLEYGALQLLWKYKKMRVREICEHLQSSRDVAVSSVAVILDRLHEKGVVGRDVETGKGGLRYIYYPLKDQKQFETSIIEMSVNSLIEKFGKSAVSYFNQRFSK
ncbi:MAG: BlaI/MecI/CopY family transcriptional regulator [bacterium]|nr:BlaI/MecI/CopY family transcriptional regulator [bacterium]